MLALGTRAPDFSLLSLVTGEPVTLATFEKKKALLVMFICCHCPYVVHVREGLARLGQDYRDKDLGIMAISSNDAEHYPDDAPAKLKKMALNLKFTFPMCYDESQEVAKAYTAACTPDFFLFDRGRKLVYRGQMDDSRPGSGMPVTGKDLRAAIEAALSDKPVSREQRPSVGCNIKWKPGNEPDYYARL